MLYDYGHTKVGVGIQKAHNESCLPSDKEQRGQRPVVHEDTMDRLK
jgi:hypothetical protein